MNGEKEPIMKYIVDGDLVLSQPPTGPLVAQIGDFAVWAREQGYGQLFALPKNPARSLF